MLPNLFQQDGAPAHRSQHTVAYLCLNVPEFFEPENLPPNSPDLNPVDYAVWGHCSRGCIVAKFHTLTSWTCAYRLLGSAKPGHIESSDRSAAKKTDDGHQGKGCPRGVSSGLTLWENDSSVVSLYVSVNWVKSMCSGHIYHNFSCCDDLSKFGKEYLHSLKCQLCTFFSIKLRKFWHTARLSRTNRHKVIKSEKQSGFLAYPVVDRNPRLIQSSLCPRKSAPEWTHDRFIRFCTHVCPADRPRFVRRVQCLCTVCVRCGPTTLNAVADCCLLVVLRNPQKGTGKHKTCWPCRHK